MRIVKPDQLYVMPRVLDNGQDGVELTVTAALGMRMQSDAQHLTDQDIWEVIQRQVGMGVFDLWHPKPAGEFLLWGHARAEPPVSRRSLVVECGSLRKEIVVIGNRRWQHGPWGIRATDPELFSDIRLGWNVAWGGHDHPDNPVGCGLPPEPASGSASSRLPNLFDPAQADEAGSNGGRAVSFSGRNPGWAARYSQGTFDDKWLARRWPGEPEDADSRNHFLADADQRGASFWEGGERIRLTGFHSTNHPIEWQVPEFSVRTCYRRSGEDTLHLLESVLDTIALFPDEQVAVLLYRSRVPRCGTDGRDVAMVMVAAEHRAEQRPVSYYDAHLQQRDSQTQRTSFARLNDALMPGGAWERETTGPDMQTPLAASSVVVHEPAPLGVAQEDAGGVTPSAQPETDVAADAPQRDDSPHASATQGFEDISRQHLAATDSALEQLISQLRAPGADMGALLATTTRNALPPDMAQSLDETLAQLQLMQGVADTDAMNAALAAQLETIKESLARMPHGMASVQAVTSGLPPALQSLVTPSPTTLNLPEVTALMADPGALLQSMTQGAEPSATGTAAQGWSSMRAAANSASAARQGDVDALVRGTDPSSLLGAFTANAQSSSAAPGGSATESASKLMAAAQMQMPAWAAEQFAAANAAGIGVAMEHMEEAMSMRDAIQENGMSPQELLKQAQLDFEVLASKAVEAPGGPESPVDRDARPSAADEPVVGSEAMAIPSFLGSLADARRHAVDRALAGHDVSEEEATALGQQLLAALRKGESLQGRDFAGADLRGANLEGAILTGVYLECARLQGACLVNVQAENAVFVEACLDGANCSGGRFIEANLNATQARGSVWTGADMTGGTMIGARFDKARATGVVMVRCVATRSGWQGANLDASRIEDSRFDDADFRLASWRSAEWSRVDAQSCQLDEVDATQAQLDSCRFVGARGSAWCLEDASVEGCAFLDARLPLLKGVRLAAKDTTWHSAVLTGADFEQAHLENAYLAEAQLSDASLVRADLRNALFNGAVLRGSSFAQAQLLGANLRCVDARRGDFRQAQLRKSDFTGACLDCADMTGADLPAGSLTLPSHV